MADDLSDLEGAFQDALRGYTDKDLNQWILDADVEELANFVDCNGNINYKSFARSRKQK